jgi:hypothetical protein
MTLDTGRRRARNPKCIRGHVHNSTPGHTRLAGAPYHPLQDHRVPTARFAPLLSSAIVRISWDIAYYRPSPSTPRADSSIIVDPVITIECRLTMLDGAGCALNDKAARVLRRVLQPLPSEIRRRQQSSTTMTTVHGVFPFAQMHQASAITPR